MNALLVPPGHVYYEPKIKFPKKTLKSPQVLIFLSLNRGLLASMPCVLNAAICTTWHADSDCSRRFLTFVRNSS